LIRGNPKPFNIETKAILAEFDDEIDHVLPDTMRKTESIVQDRNAALLRAERARYQLTVQTNQVTHMSTSQFATLRVH
jgi:hypothetical protein